MIDIIKFWEAVGERTVTGTSGYDDSFIEKVNESQMQLMTALLPHYEKNQTIKDILNVFLETISKSTTIGTGKLDLEGDYMQFSSVKSADGKPAYPINNNEVAIINDSAIRKPNVAKGNIFYYQQKNSIYFLPSDVSILVTYDYIRKFADAALTLTPTTTADVDYLVPSTTGKVDMEWPPQVFNLLLYIFLEKLGMEMKEPIIIEYANLGLSKEMVNLDPQ